jgi:hypothetical protein
VVALATLFWDMRQPLGDLTCTWVRNLDPNQIVSVFRTSALVLLLLGVMAWKQHHDSSCIGMIPL